MTQSDKFQKIASEVAAAGGLLGYSMEQLRDAYDARRLGSNVRQGISDKLREHGLGHLPTELPANQHEEIRIYATGKPLGRVINAVLSPSRGGDKLLLEVANTDAREIIRRVRELVCE